jgi:hypothetical protein
MSFPSCKEKHSRELTNEEFLANNHNSAYFEIAPCCRLSFVIFVGLNPLSLSLSLSLLFFAFFSFFLLNLVCEY